MRDEERVNRIMSALRKAQLDSLICALPAYVLMTTGYWPVVGTSIVVTNADGEQVALVPEDEEDLARLGWARVRTYQPSSLEKLQSVAEAAAGPLRRLLRDMAVERGCIGFEAGPVSEPASYAAMHLFGKSITSLIHAAAPAAQLVPADDLLAALASEKTPSEVEKIQIACEIAEHAFSDGVRSITAGARETEIAAMFRGPLVTFGTGYCDVARAEGFAYCMSGPNSAKAHGAYARSRTRQIRSGDLVLIHCNSCANGYWTDITRTYLLRDPDERTMKVYEAVFAARKAALDAIRPGVRASEVDRAARNTLAKYGFAKAFKHPTGHGVGFAAISANARPRIHPKSDEVLQPGMVFNVEPAVYMEEVGGLRHCDMVAITVSGVDVLTPYHATFQDLVLSSAEAKRKLIA